MTGTGAYKNGGRWNTPGHYAVYTSGNLSLAMLEVVVHVDDAEAFLDTPHG
jgi:RES domain-containing protein